MCYKKFDQSKSFLDAEQHCNTQGGNLARISSEAENKLVGTIGGGGPFWIGLWSGGNSCFKDRHSGVWTDGTPGNGFSRWRTQFLHSEPDCYKKESGAGMGVFFNHEPHNNLWDDDSILRLLPFVCGMFEGK